MTTLEDDVPPLSPGDEPAAVDDALAHDALALFLRFQPGAALVGVRTTMNAAHGPIWRADYRPALPQSRTVWRFVYWRKPSDEIGVATATVEDAGPLA